MVTGPARLDHLRAPTSAGHEDGNLPGWEDHLPEAADDGAAAQVVGCLKRRYSMLLLGVDMSGLHHNNPCMVCCDVLRQNASFADGLSTYRGTACPFILTVRPSLVLHLHIPIPSALCARCAL